MILTCPECATSYFVDDLRIPRLGRMVKCTNCSHRWRAFQDRAEAEKEIPEDDLVFEEKSEPEPEPPPEEEIEFVAAPAIPRRRNGPPPRRRPGGMYVVLGIVAGVAVVAGQRCCTA